MFKYIYYVYILFIGLLVKLINPVWYWVVVPYREKARNIVYSYVVTNNIYLKELYKDDGYKAVTRDKNISWLKYTWYKNVIWIWIYDTATLDTFNRSDCWTFLVNYKTDKNTSYFKKWIYTGISNITYTNLDEGSSFYLGNIRNGFEYRNLRAELLHIYNHSDSNFDYMYFITDDVSKLFYIKIFKYEFGWKPCNNTLGGIGYKLCFFKPLIEE